MRFSRALITVCLVLVASSCLADAGSPGEKVDLWHGYTRRTFTVDGCQAWVVEPKQMLPGKPWSWCMEFPDAFTDRCAAPALLEKGFHHVHMVVGNTFGSPAAMRHFNAFYDVLRRRGLAKKAVLIGLSRGGLYAYRWASENPDKVAVIYGDAPVCDFKSWPGGRGTGKGSPADWAQLLTCYGFKDETEALAYRGNPVDVLETLAKAGIAIIHVVGDVDDVVPVAENTAIIEARYHKLGGEVQVIHKPGVGHHPHGLDDPTPVVKFIMDHVTGTSEQQAADQHDMIGVAATRQDASSAAVSTDHWFPQAGLGIFIHWGLASIPGNLDLSWGGNVPANYGPRPDGEMPDCLYRNMAEIKDWMTHSGTSLVDVVAGLYPDKCNVPVTVRDKTWYAHLLPKTSDGPASDGTIALTGITQPRRAAMLATGRELAMSAGDDTLTIEVPKELRTEMDDVVVIEW